MLKLGIYPSTAQCAAGLGPQVDTSFLPMALLSERQSTSQSDHDVVMMLVRSGPIF